MLNLLLALFLTFTIPDTHHRNNIRVSVHPSPAAVAVRITLESPDYSAASQFEVGSRSVYWADFRQVPSGEYILDGVEITAAGKISQAPSQHLFVQ